MKEKRCNTCETVKPMTEFKKYKTDVLGFFQTPRKELNDGTGHAPKCKRCTQDQMNASARAWRKRNKDKVNKYSYKFQRMEREKELQRRRHPTDGIPWAATLTL